MIRRFLRCDCRVLIVLWMWCGKISAVKVVVVFLLAMVRQRAATNLTTGNTTPVGEACEKKCVDVRHLLETGEHFVCTFIDERYRADLNADHAAIVDAGV